MKFNRVTALLLSLTLAFSLAACGQGASSASSASSSAASSAAAESKTEEQLLAAAEKAGMRKGDVITAVDGTEVKKEDFAAVKSKLENAAKVLVTVSRDGQPSSFELTASPYVLVTALFFLSGILTQFMSNTASCALLWTA